MREVKKIENRLMNIIVSDKKENPTKLLKVLRSEFINILKNYFEIACEDVFLDIDVSEDGNYCIHLNAVSRMIKMIKCFDN